MLLAIRSRQTVSQYVEEHSHKQGTPTMGGLILIVGLAAAFLSWLGNESLSSWVPQAFVLLLGFGAIGFIDDFLVPRWMSGKRGLGWTPKLAMQLVTAIAAAALGPRPLTGADFALFVFLILFYSNAFNFSDGLDGLAGSLLIGMSLGFGYLSMHPAAEMNHALALAFVGSVIPFLTLNAPPAKVFMGDVGALPVGALVGMAAAASLPSTASQRLHLPYYWLPVLLWSLVMVAELVPVPMQIAWVKLFKKRLFPFTPIHHAWQRAGMPETRIVWRFFVVQLACSFLAVEVSKMLARPR
jgi:phospho-N-acetylmuramoyl-pentapeptide-transferase